MEAAEPINNYETPNPSTDDSIINFIEELIIKKETGEYKIRIGTKGKTEELIIKVASLKMEDLFYYQQSYTRDELHKLSKIFYLYDTMTDLIEFFKNIEYEITEKNDVLILKFNIFMPDGKSKLIELDLKKNFICSDKTIKYLLEEINLVKTNMCVELSTLKNNYESEIKNLKQNILDNQKIISNLKENISNNENEILNLKKKIQNYENENNKLWNELKELKKLIQSNETEKPKKFILDSKIIEPTTKINFLLDYIKENDKLLFFNEIKLLYRGSRDGDETKICHELCDNKQNVLIIMQSDTGYIFGGYSKIGFKTINDRSKFEYKIDNNCFLFSINLEKIYPVIKDSKAICHIHEACGLCFFNSISFYVKFLNKKDNAINKNIKTIFNGIEDYKEMIGGNEKFKCKELEVFQLL